MPRPADDDLAPLDEIDRSAVPTANPDSVLGLLEQLLRAANSDESRLRIMTAARFPSTDIPTFLAVNQLALHGALRPTDLSERLETGRPNTTKIIQRLERLNLVARTAHPEDERGVLVVLTALGRETAERIINQEQQWLSRVVLDWTPDELDCFRRQLTRFLADFTSAAGITPDATT